jgi:hypothetical protein
VLGGRRTRRLLSGAALFLVGDAGTPGENAVLRVLETDVTAAVAALGAERVAVVFLGDNVYPDGMPPPARAAERRRAEAVLDAQLAVVAGGRARAVFVPGNHDWNSGRAGGWARVREQARYLGSRDTRARLLPANGCPGPAARDVGARLRLVALDTHWWLHRHAKPAGAESPCPARDEAEVVAALRAALRATGERHAIVVGHHPLRSGGRHAGYRPWTAHLFPLRALHGAFWLPLPGVASLVVLGERAAAGDQDLSSPRYRRLAAALDGVFRAAPPLVYAAGHDHHLEVLRASEGGYVLVVSGAGSPSKLTPVRARAAPDFAAAAPGFVRLDALSDGSVALRVVTVGAGATGAQVYARCLTGRC